MTKTKLILSKVALSANPDTQVNKKGTHNVSKDGREFFVATYSEIPSMGTVAGARLRTHTRTVWSNNDGSWQMDPISQKPMDMSYYSQLAGKPTSVVECEFITHHVVPYELDGRSVSTYTTPVFAGENVFTIFKNAGKQIVNPLTGEVIGETKEESISVA